MNIGLLPEDFRGKVVFVGNTSKEGGISLLLNQKLRATADDLVRKITTVELADRNDFDRLFVKAMSF